MANPLRILTVYQTNPLAAGQGGGVRYVRNLLAEQRNFCDEVLFFGVGPRAESAEHLRFLPLTAELGGYPRFLFKLGWKLLFLDAKDYALVHVHRLYFAIPFLLLKPKLPVVCTLHGRTFSVFGDRFGGAWLKLVMPIFKAIERFALKRVRRLVPVSQDVLRSFEDKYPELMASRRQDTSIIGSMLDLDDFGVRDSDYLQRRYGAQNRYLVFLGRLSAVKDVDFLLRLFAERFQEQPDVKLVLVGSGEEEQRLRQAAQALCPTNAPIFHGAISPDDVPELLNSAHLLLLTSQHEASPTIVKEALASGLPVLSNRVGDVEDFIVPGENGHVLPKDIASYGDAIQALLAEPLAATEVARVSAEALGHCTRQRVGKRYLELYEDLLPKGCDQAMGSVH